MQDIQLLYGDCLELMKDIPDGSIDMILCDLPYGTTACKWDEIIPFGKLWEQYERVTKLNAPIVLTASQPFTSALVMSNPKWFRHEWIWQKGDKKLNEQRIHETQKPVLLYKYILDKYAKKGDKILDTHGGSRSLAIACYDMGFDHVSCELDIDHHNSSKARFDAHVADYAPVSDVAVNSEGQLKMF